MRQLIVPALALVGCASSSEPVTPPAPAVVVPSQIAVQARGVSASTDRAALAATDVAEALSTAFADPASGDYSEDGDVDLSARRIGGCVSVSLSGGDLVLTFAGCHRLSGTMRLSHWFGQTTVWFDDDFAVGGVDLDGQLSLTARVLLGEYAFDGAITYGGDALTVDLDMSIAHPTELWGYVDVAQETLRGPATVRVDLGDETAPLEYDGTCTCPTSGEGSLESSITVDAVTVDLDDVFAHEPGAGTYPPLTVPVAPTDIDSSTVLTFDARCVDALATVTADDVSFEILAEDVAASVQTLCDDGRMSTEQCDELLDAAGTLPKTVTVEVAFSVVADAVEPKVQDKLDAACNVL